MEAHHSNISPGNWQVWVRKGFLHPLSITLGSRASAGPPGLRCQTPTLGLSQWCGCEDAKPFTVHFSAVCVFLYQPKPTNLILLKP